MDSNPRSPVAEATSHVQCLEICCISYGRPRVRICLPPTESPCLEGIRLPTSKGRALPRVCAAWSSKTAWRGDIAPTSSPTERAGKSAKAFLAELEFKAAEFEWVCGQSLVRTYEAPVRRTPPRVCARQCRQWIGASSVVPAGTLDGDPGIRPQRQRHIFVDFKAPWFEITDSVGQFGTKPKPS